MKTKKIDKNELIDSSIIIENYLNSKVLIIKSEYNNLLTNSICNGILNELSEMNIKENTIGLMSIPGGAFELPLATKKLIEKTKPKVVIVVGCIISPDGAGTTPRSL